MGAHALLEPDIVGDFGQLAFSLLLQPGVRHGCCIGRDDYATGTRGL